MLYYTACITRLYYTEGGPRLNHKANPQLGFHNTISPDFVRQWTDGAKEYSRRYGNKIKGWWVGGCYLWLGYNDEYLRLFVNPLKAGNL